MQKFSYESLVKDYETNLETQTRGFSAGLPWLETWVPDDDVLASVNNLIEAAQNGGIDSVALSVKMETLKLLSENNLAAHFSHLGKIFIRSSDEEVIIEMSDLQKAILFSITTRRRCDNGVITLSFHLMRHMTPLFLKIKMVAYGCSLANKNRWFERQDFCPRHRVRHLLLRLWIYFVKLLSACLFLRCASML